MGITVAQARQLRFGSQVYGRAGGLLGHLGQVYIDLDTLHPLWASIGADPDGSQEALVPLDDAALDGPRLVLPYSKDQLETAPHPHTGEPPTVGQEDDLYRHYRLRT